MTRFPSFLMLVGLVSACGTRQECHAPPVERLSCSNPDGGVSEALVSKTLQPDTDEATADYGCSFTADGGTLVAAKVGEVCRVREVLADTDMRYVTRVCRPPVGEWTLIDPAGHSQRITVTDAGITCGAP